MRELTNAQKEYFKDSQIKDNSGNLIVCYHITNIEFDTFNKEKINQVHNAFNGQGFYFSTSDKYDETFGSEYKGCFGDIKHECYINMKNPLIIDDVDLMEAIDIMEYMKEHHPDYGKPDGPTPIETDIAKYPKDDEPYKLIPEAFNSQIFAFGAWSEYSAQLTAYAKENGYDGIIQKPLGLGEPTEVVVFEPNQIKSIDNLFPTKSDNFKDNSKEYLQNPNLSFEEREVVFKAMKEKYANEKQKDIKSKDRGGLCL